MAFRLNRGFAEPFDDTTNPWAPTTTSAAPTTTAAAPTAAPANPWTRDTLAGEIKKRWGGDAVWNLGGEDVAPLFADRLIKHGLTDLDKFTGIKNVAAEPYTYYSGGESGGEYTTPGLESALLTYGDKDIGYFGSKQINPSLQWSSAPGAKTIGTPQVASWVNTAKGGADIYAVQDPETGQLRFVPIHVSSNESKTIKAELAKALSVMAAPLAFMAAPAAAGLMGSTLAGNALVGAGLGGTIGGLGGGTKGAIKGALTGGLMPFAGAYLSDLAGPMMSGGAETFAPPLDAGTPMDMASLYPDIGGAELIGEGTSAYTGVGNPGEAAWDLAKMPDYIPPAPTAEFPYPEAPATTPTAEPAVPRSAAMPSGPSLEDLTAADTAAGLDPRFGNPADYRAAITNPNTGRIATEADIAKEMGWPEGKIPEDLLKPPEKSIGEKIADSLSEAGRNAVDQVVKNPIPAALVAAGAIGSATGPEPPEPPTSPTGPEGGPSVDEAVQDASDSIKDPQYYQDLADAIYNKQKLYMDPRYTLEEKLLRSRLGEQGFISGGETPRGTVPGSPAYLTAMDTFNQGKERAYQAAQEAAVAGAYGQGNIQSAKELELARLLADIQNIGYNQQLGQYNAKVAGRDNLWDNLLQAGLYFGGGWNPFKTPG